MLLVLIILIHDFLERSNPSTLFNTMYDIYHTIMYLADLYRHIIFLTQHQEGKAYV